MPLKSYFTKEAPVSNCQGPSLMSLSSAPPAPCSSPWLQNSLSPPVLLLSTFRATTHRLSWSLLSLSASFQLKSAAELSHLPKQMPHIFTESNAGTIPHSSPHRGREGGRGGRVSAPLINMQNIRAMLATRIFPPFLHGERALASSCSE